MVAVPRIFIPLGTRFDRLVVIGVDRRVPPNASQIAKGRTVGSRALLMRCDCGNELLATIGNLRAGHVKSCGCYRSDRMKTGNVQGTHRYSNHQSFDRWTGMVQRCESPWHKSYPDYGGRGITVCDAWHDAVVFCDWLDANLGPCPPGWSLDRIDNAGNYEPGNVRWASASEQALNRRKKRSA